MLWLNHIKYSGRQYGAYIIEKAVGEGRYGICFRAHSNCGLQVIIKRFKPTLIKKYVEKNTAEAVILSQVNNTAIPKFLGVINEKDFYGYIFEQKPGDTVQALLFKQKHHFTREEIYRTVSQLIDIMCYLHDKGIIHGDIRPPNVLINDDTIYLIDFGLSRRVSFTHGTYSVDFSYLGDFLLYLLYSSYKPQKWRKRAWYDELDLSPAQKMFIKRLLQLEEPFVNVEEVKDDFRRAFNCEQL